MHYDFNPKFIAVCVIYPVYIKTFTVLLEFAVCIFFSMFVLKCIPSAKEGRKVSLFGTKGFILITFYSKKLYLGIILLYALDAKYTLYIYNYTSNNLEMARVYFSTMLNSMMLCM